MLSENSRGENLARQKILTTRSLHIVNEQFEGFFNTARLRKGNFLYNNHATELAAKA